MSAAAAVAPGDDIYDNGTQRVSSSSCSIPKSWKCSFCAKLIMNVTAAMLEMLFVIRVLTLILSFLSCHVNDIVGSARPGFQK